MMLEIKGLRETLFPCLPSASKTRKQRTVRCHFHNILYLTDFSVSGDVTLRDAFYGVELCFCRMLRQCFPLEPNDPATNSTERLI